MISYLSVHGLGKKANPTLVQTGVLSGLRNETLAVTAQIHAQKGVLNGTPMVAGGAIGMAVKGVRNLYNYAMPTGVELKDFSAWYNCSSSLCAYDEITFNEN